jgi:tRNA(adenine34) deaminase
MTLQKDILYMREALKEAQRAFVADEVPVGCVIVHEGAIIARAHNQMRMLKDPTAHAEMIAITQAAGYLRAERLHNCSVYVTIEPCPMCAGALVWARVKRLAFAAHDEKAGACGSVVNIVNNARLNHRVKTQCGILEKESQALMKEFFKRKRAQKRLDKATKEA